MIERTWYYYRDSLQEGPIAESALRSLIANRRIPNDVLVHCSEISEEWHSASEVDAFRNLGGMAISFDAIATPPVAGPPSVGKQTPSRYKTPALPNQLPPALPPTRSIPQALPPLPRQSPPVPPARAAPRKQSAGQQLTGCLSRVFGLFLFIAIGSAIKSCNNPSSTYTAPQPVSTPVPVVTPVAPPATAPPTPAYAPSTPDTSTSDVTAPAGFTLSAEKTIKSPDGQVTINQYEGNVGNDTLWQFWAIQDTSKSQLNPGETTYYPAGFRFTNDSQWLVRMQKVGSGEASLFLYHRTQTGWASAVKPSLSDSAWTYFKSLPDYQLIVPPDFHFNAVLVRGVEDDYKSLNEEWPDSRYLVISLSGDALPTSTHGQIQSVSGWRCRYDLQNAVFDVPPDFTENNARAIPPAAVPAPPPAFAPPSVAPVPQSYTVMDESGKSFTVSASDYQVLQQMKARMAPLLDSINKLKAKQDQDSRQINNERATLDNTDQSSVDQFNTYVDAFNADKGTLDHEIDDYNARVKEHNDYLLRVGTPTN